MLPQSEFRWGALIIFFLAPLMAQESDNRKSEQPADPAQFVGPETCKGCHEEQGASFDKSLHAKPQKERSGPQWQGCEACHGPGKSHAEAGDPANIVRFEALSRADAGQICSR